MWACLGSIAQTLLIYLAWKVCAVVVGDDDVVLVVHVVVANRTIQRPVLVHALPWSTNCPLYLTLAPMPNFMNCSLHLVLHGFVTDIREMFARPEMR